MSGMAAGFPGVLGTNREASLFSGPDLAARGVLGTQLIDAPFEERANVDQSAVEPSNQPSSSNKSSHLEVLKMQITPETRCKQF